MGKITSEQQKILDGFICERLTDNKTNRDIIKNFSNSKGVALVEYLQNDAWKEDEEGTTAVYLVKNTKNEVVLFFSLKCGALFNSLDEDRIRQKVTFCDHMIHSLSKKGSSKNILKIVEEIRSRQRDATDILNQLNEDKNHEKNSQIIRVDYTYPGIELFQFCSNDSAQENWKKLGFNHPMGEVIFWYFIAPIIYEIPKRVGCQYVYLFAADISLDESLITYYNVSLKFELPKTIGTTKPAYDFCCTFMCQEIKDLRKHRKDYFDNFNPDHSFAY